MSNGGRITAVLTAFNRRDSTIASLRAFFGQEGDFDLAAVVMDDGSKDGTGDAVRAAFSRAKVLTGDGSLFWNGGMAEAFDEARRDRPDYYLWLNDDTLLDADAIGRLVDDARAWGNARGCIVVGSARDPDSGRLTYGGLLADSAWHPGKFKLIGRTNRVLPCAAMNGNIVLISAEAADRVGGIDRNFTHSMGDYDYALTANRLGVPVVVGRGLHGSCARNPPGSSWTEQPNPWRRYRKAVSPKGLPPREWAYFLRKHGNALWPLAWLTTYRRIFTG